MNRTTASRLLSVNWRGPCSVLALAVMLAPLGARTAAPAALPAALVAYHAQPILLQLAAQRPSTAVQVIVEQTGRTANAAGLISSLGGHVTKTLSIIDALAATVPARAIPTLATAAGVRWVSLDAPVAKADYAVSAATLQSVYNQTIGASQLWNEAPANLRGQGIGVAVVDSGITAHPDFTAGGNRIVASVNMINVVTSTSGFTGTGASADDFNGHGTHVAGIIAGNGANSNGAYIGVAPAANLIDVKIADAQGRSSVSDVVSALQWILFNAQTYNIHVVNLSLNSDTADSYNVDPLDAAVEILWASKIVVVVAAGNNQLNNPGVIYPPANDPYVITVGAADDHGSASPSDDTLAAFSAYGTTPDGVSKPDLVAPGVNIVAPLPATNVTLALAHPDHIVDALHLYFRMSGTSMSTPVVAGAVALLLQSNPSLTPDQVKSLLMATARPMGTGTGAGELNIYAAVHSLTTPANVNAGNTPSHVLTSGDGGASWNTWNAANWGSANWGSANWGSANWGSANWGSANWGSANWGSAYSSAAWEDGPPGHWRIDHMGAWNSAYQVYQHGKAHTGKP